MIDLFTILTTSGIILWQSPASPVPGDVVNDVIADIFIENWQVEGTIHKSGLSFCYLLVNELNLLFLCAFKAVARLTWVTELVHDIQRLFLGLLGDELRAKKAGKQPLYKGLDTSKFSSLYDLRVEEVERHNDQRDSKDIAKSEPQGRKTRRGNNKKDTPENKSKANKTSGKEMRAWEGEYGNSSAIDKSMAKELDFSATGTDAPRSKQDQLTSSDLEKYGARNQQGEFVVSELSSELHELINTPQTSSEGSGSAFLGFLQKYIGGKTLTDADLESTLKATHSHLMTKNVANEAAEHICEVVKVSLVGQKTDNWTSVKQAVHTAMAKELRKILTPKTSVDLLREVTTRKKHSRPYVISVVGVNGVGKSTNLSKIGFWLLQNKLRVLVAACDTFRSGAVEQLKVHVDRLTDLTSRLGGGHVELFDQGYGKDAAVIAQKAVEYAHKNDFDVVLIDTAGRRHNDDRLMSSLEKFGRLAAPDKIIMVGEALVGTDSVLQAQNFNAAFGKSRNLDFFLVSKCDTVGDMIGSMVNMTYSTGIPVLFVGIGQNYTDLRALSIDWAVNMLMQ